MLKLRVDEISEKVVFGALVFGNARLIVLRAAAFLSEHREVRHFCRNPG